MQGMFGATPMGAAPIALPPAPPQFPSTDPAAIAELVASVFAQMAQADHMMLEAQQQAALAAADPLVQQLLGGGGAPAPAPEAAPMPADPMMGYAEGALPPADPNMVGA